MKPGFAAFLCLLFWSCRPSPDPNSLRALQAAVVRLQPEANSLEMATLPKGAQLKDLGLVGPVETEILIDGQTRQSPWIKVLPENCQAPGWVLAIAVAPGPNRSDWLTEKRARCYFKDGLVTRCQAWRRQLEVAQTERQLARVFEEALELRKAMTGMLSNRPETPFRPDFFWIKEIFPGFEVQQGATDPQPEICTDFLFWQQKAKSTGGGRDDAFFGLCLAFYPLDSVESRFPAWVFPVSEHQVASQLGSGRHYEALQRLSDMLPQNELFGAALLSFKEMILTDILEQKQQFWQPAAKIQEEMQRILESPPSCLTAQERAQLQIRARMFDDPQANGIEVNLRAGGQ